MFNDTQMRRNERIAIEINCHRISHRFFFFVLYLMLQFFHHLPHFFLICKHFQAASSDLSCSKFMDHLFLSSDFHSGALFFCNAYSFEHRVDSIVRTERFIMQIALQFECEPFFIFYYRLRMDGMAVECGKNF